MSERINLTKNLIETLKPSANGKRLYLYDSKIPGFGLSITSTGTKSFLVYKKLKGKPQRFTLGQFPELSVEQARKEAQKLLGKIATGIDPIAEKQTQKLKVITLKEVFEDYLKARKDLKRRTKYDYERFVYHTVFAKWQNKPLLFITKDKVVSLHSSVGEERGTAYANSSMRLLRALFNFAAGQYEDAQGQSLILDNPVRRLSQTRAWYRTKRRETLIEGHQLPAWHQAVMELENDIVRDYLLLILLTGLRRNEAAKLEKTHIDLKSKILVIGDPKNRQTHRLPLTNYLYDLLKHRIDSSPNEYVFPGNGKEGYLIEPRKQMAKIIEKTGIQFTVHDLRRTFITIAESLDIPAYALKRLLNHKTTSDVTAGYIVMDVERLRKPMNKISAYIFKCIK